MAKLLVATDWAGTVTVLPIERRDDSQYDLIVRRVRSWCKVDARLPLARRPEGAYPFARSDPPDTRSPEARMRIPTGLASPLLAFLIGLAGPAEAEDFPKDLVSWTPSPANPVFAGTGLDRGWDRLIRERGWILEEDGLFHLWYTGYNDDRSPNRNLGYAISLDGLNWHRWPSNPIVSTSWVEDVCVVKHDGIYQMFAEGERDIAHRLTSTDGIHWKEEGPLDIRKVDGTSIPPGPRGTPTAFFEDGTWFLLYERGDRGDWLATSTDLKVWTNKQDEPVLAMGPDAYDKYAVAINQVIRRDGVYYAYYHANAHNPWQKDWTTNIARSRDLIHWEKYPGNPLILNNSSSSQLVPIGGRGRLYTMHPEVRAFEPEK
ncbi:glycosylase [Tundrisphaera lichenicola]|uniref:glycosylase n=1 Tax=Tundrisphaera lichenicola TaxID=2029860 RepID=UPI003EB79566